MSTLAEDLIEELVEARKLHLSLPKVKAAIKKFKPHWERTDPSGSTGTFQALWKKADKSKAVAFVKLLRGTSDTTNIRDPSWETWDDFTSYGEEPPTDAGWYVSAEYGKFK